MTRIRSEHGVRAAEIVRDLHRRAARRGHHLPLRLWDGTELGPSGQWRLVLNHPWSLRALLGPFSDLAAGDAYLDDVVDVEGSMVAALGDLASIGELGSGLSQRSWLAKDLLQLPAPPPGYRGGAIRRRSGTAWLRGRAHSRRRDAAAVQHHYDVGNDFYRLFLGAELVYSCAVFAEEDRTRPVTDIAVLDRAQRRKLELVCRKLHLREGERLLDVGCGWGGLVLHAAREYGVRALGVTLSEEQAELAARRVREAGLDDRVKIELRDYREVEGTFDAIASVGMVEHVGESQLSRYVHHLYGLLEPGGRLLNHGITTGGRGVVRDFARDHDSFVARYVFPDGALVPARRMVAEIEAGGFEVWDLQQLRPHYARTLAHWVANLEADADRARALVGERTYRVWRAYMAGSSVSFSENSLGVIQILGVRPPCRLPHGRDWMEPRV